MGDLACPRPRSCPPAGIGFVSHNCILGPGGYVGLRRDRWNAGMMQTFSHVSGGACGFLPDQAVGENGCLPGHRQTLQIHSSQLAIQLHEYHTQRDIVRQTNSGRFSEFLQAVPFDGGKPLPGKALDKSDLALTMVVSRASLRQAQGRLCSRHGAAKMAATQNRNRRGRSPRCSTHRSDSPIGTGDPSPPFQRWVQSPRPPRAPEGRKKTAAGSETLFRPCRDSFDFRSPIPHR